MRNLQNGTMDWEVLMLRTPRDLKVMFYSHSGKFQIILMLSMMTYTIAKASQQQVKQPHE